MALSNTRATDERVPADGVWMFIINPPKPRYRQHQQREKAQTTSALFVFGLLPEREEEWHLPTSINDEGSFLSVSLEGSGLGQSRSSVDSPEKNPAATPGRAHLAEQEMSKALQQVESLVYEALHLELVYRSIYHLGLCLRYLEPGQIQDICNDLVENHDNNTRISEAASHTMVGCGSLGPASFSIDMPTTESLALL